MQTLHRALMGVALTALVAAGLGVLVLPTHVASAQHGQHGEHGQADGDQAMAEHFHAMIDGLELTADQRETLAEPLGQAFAAMQELHRLHGVIAAELTEEQQSKMNEMVHSMMGGMGGDHGDGHDSDGEHHDGGHH